MKTLIQLREKVTLLKLFIKTLIVPKALIAIKEKSSLELN